MGIHVNFKKYLLFSCSLTLFTVAGFGLKSDFAQADNGYTVSGNVTFGSDATPAEDMHVTLYDPTTGDSERAITDSNGNYSISNVPDGSYGAYLSNSAGATGTDIGYFDAVPQNQPITVNGADLTQNFSFNTNQVAVTVDYADGTPITGASVEMESANSGSEMITDSSGTMDFGVSGGELTATGSTDGSGVAYMDVVPGLTYTVCASISSGSETCSADVTVSSDTTDTINYGPSAPTNLTAPTPTDAYPSLSWASVSGATSYNIYRNGTDIGSSTTNSYTDTAAPQGTSSYYVTAVNSSGESSPSNTISVLYSTAAPTITYTVTPIADSNGYNTGNVLVTFNCTDNSGSGIASCTSPVTVPDEGIGSIVAGTATDNAGNTTMINANASLLVSAISAGGNGSSPYGADTSYSGGSTYSSSASVDTSNVLNPAPQSVYQNCRYGNTFSYTFSGLTPSAAYTLRLDFNELYWGTALSSTGGIGSRVFNVAVNGSPALTNFDIYAAAGGSNKAISEQFDTTADSNGNITVTFTSDTDNAMVNGLSLYNGTLPPLAPTPPATSAYIAAGSSTAIGNFSADNDYSGGTTYTTSASVDTSGVTNPAPQAVYQSDRYGTNFTYTVPNLVPNTNYNVRLDFSEPYWGVNNNGGAGSRLFNVAINGTQVLNDFDVYATAGGANKAIAENFTATSDSNGRISINFTAVTDNAMVSGIEVSEE
jgi:Malectin domain